MPKAARHALLWQPEEGIYELHEQGNGHYRLLTEDDEQWFDWLASHSSFSFQGQHGHVNLLKEARKSGGEGYWYAYRRQGKHTVKKYAGRSTDLTMTRLEALASTLTSEATDRVLDQALPMMETFVPQLTPLSPTLEGKEEVTTERGPGFPIVYSSQQQAPLLEPKLSLPRLPVSLVPRERLFVQLDGGLERKLTVLSAPAGFGKTTLVRQWVAERSMHQPWPAVAWVSLDPGDNDPLRFWRYVITACQPLQVDSGRSALASLAMVSQPPFKPSSLERLLTTFLNALARSTGTGILILEDYHAITSPHIHEMMMFFLDHLPANMHVILMTRNVPSLSLARLRASADLCEVHAADLRFSREEMIRFLQQSTSFSLSEEALRRLEDHLEGWPAGLRLLALALHGHTDRRAVEHILATFSGSHRSLQDYFVTEVLNGQPEPMQRFLLHTSMLGRLTGSLCNAITGRSDSTQLLEGLERAGLFLESLDESGEWYRYHALFAEAMQAEARHRLGSAALQAISRKASLWYEQHDMLSAAIEAAIQAKDVMLAVRLIEQFVGKQPYFFVGYHRFREVSEFHTLHHWLEQLPERVLRQHPVLCFSYATALLFVYLIDQSPFVGEEVERLKKLLQMAEQGFRVEGNTEKLGEVLSFYALLARRQGAIREAVSYARQALSLLPAEESVWRGVSLSAEGTGELFEGRLDAARQRFLEAHEYSKVTGNPSFIRANIGMLSAVTFEQGELHRAAEYYHQMLAEAREQDDYDDITHALVGLAQISYEWNDLEVAERQAQEALDHSQRFVDEEIRIYSSLILARIRFAQGQIAAALQQCSSLLARMPAILPNSPPVYYQLYREIQALQARLQLAVGDFATIQRWWSSRSQYEAMLPQFQCEREEILMARWLLARGEPQEALVVLHRLLSSARKAGRARSMLEIEALTALAYAASKQMQEAQQTLRTMLPFAHAEGYLRLFLDEGDAMATLLRITRPHLRERPLITYIQTILRAFAQEQPAASSQIVPGASPLLEPLSPQELRVLRLLAAGRSNPEIAGELVVSVNTIRTQVQSIYRKLNVNNRMAAGEMARHLQLL